MERKIVSLLLVLFFAVGAANAQINLKKKLMKRANKATDKALDKAEDGIGNLLKKKTGKDKDNKNDDDEQNDEPVDVTEEINDNESQKEYAPNVNWSAYDFVPGDEIIFDDIPSPAEENGEFPSRWDLIGGQIEIAEADGEKVIMFIDGSPDITPYMKDREADYLPDIFTIEMDLYKPKGSNRIFMNLYNKKHQAPGKNHEITIGHDYIDVGDIRGKYPKELSRDKGRWIHVSIAYTKGKLKLYMDDTRLINIPHYEGNPTGLSIQCYFADSEHRYLLKNVRIAKGGVKYYDRVLNEGKIICHGIKFDVNKATLRPESMGSINEIYSLMEKNPGLKFSVEGHTDSDGSDTHNQQLSEARAKAVMQKLVDMGIDKSRLTSKGFGESKPMANNTTAEGKAQNRRVEFVKMK